MRQLHFCGKDFILNISEEEEVAIYNVCSEATTVLKPGHEGSAKNASMDPIGDFLATTGCDGNVHIYSLPMPGQKPELVTKKRICGKTLVESDLVLEPAWTHNGSVLLTPGERMIGVLTRDTWQFKHEETLTHDKEISICRFATAEVLLTAGLDNKVKVWDWENKRGLYFIETESPVLSIKYS